MNPAEIAILFLIGYSILITLGFIFKSFELRKHKALFDVEFIKYPKVVANHGFKTAPLTPQEEALKADALKLAAYKAGEFKKREAQTVITAHERIKIEIEGFKQL